MYKKQVTKYENAFNRGIFEHFNMFDALLALKLTVVVIGLCGFGNKLLIRTPVLHHGGSRVYHPQLVAVYHQCGALYITNGLPLYIIKAYALYIIIAEHCIDARKLAIPSLRSLHQAAERCTLKRDEIQGRFAALDDIHRTSCVDDMPSLRLG